MHMLYTCTFSGMPCLTCEPRRLRLSDCTVHSHDSFRMHPLRFLVNEVKACEGRLLGKQRHALLAQGTSHSRSGAITS